MRIVITGHPKSGKTSLAKAFNCKHTQGTDELIETHEWSEQSETASYWFDCKDPHVIEGCALTRALRKWRRRNPKAKPPFDIFIYLECRGEPTPMAKANDTIMTPIWDWLDESNIMILRGTL